MNNILARAFRHYGDGRTAGKLFALILAVTLSAQGGGAGTLTIAALGDSLTQGYGLVPEDGLVPRLKSWLNENGRDVRIINAGVSGDTTAGGLARIDWTLTPDVQALIVALGGNDLLRGIDPMQTRHNLDAILERAGMRGLPVLLIGLEAPRNLGPDYKTAFDGIYPELAAAHGTLLFPSFLAPLREGRDTAGILEDLMQADGIHPNAAGVEVIVAALGPMVLRLIDRSTKVAE